MDFSNTTVNVIKVEASWWKTIKRVVPRYSSSKPLLLTTRPKGTSSRLYLNGRCVAEMVKGFGMVTTKDDGVIINGDVVYRHPEQTMEAIDKLNEISPEFAMWLLFNLDEIL